MKLLNLLIILIFVTSNAFAGFPPTTLSGLQDTTKTTTFNFQVPNKLATKTPTGTLSESGNTNLLADPSFESANPSAKWTLSPATPALNNTTQADGKYALDFSPSGAPVEISQDSSLNAGAFADGTVQGIAMAMVKTNITNIQLCPRRANAIVSSLCVTVPSTNKWTLVKVPFILGATSNGISVNSVGYANVTGTISVDKMFVGAQDVKVDGDASKFLGGVAYGAGASASGWRNYSGTGTLISGSSGFSYDDSTKVITLPLGGDYKIEYGVAYNVSTASSGLAVAITVNGVTEQCGEVALGGGDTGARPKTFCNLKNLPSNSTITLRQYTSSALAGIEGFVHIFKFSSGSTYSSTNADTDWQSCGHTASDFTGFGTPTLIETQCKRTGSDLLMKGKFTGGTTSATEARLALKFNGATLTSASSTKIPSLQVIGQGAANLTSTTYFGGVTVLIEPSVSYVTWGLQTSGNQGIVKQNGSAFGSPNPIVSFSARIPIEGWENSNVIVAQLSGLESCKDSYECTDLYTATVNGYSNSGVATDLNVSGWVTCSRTITGKYTCVPKTSLFTVVPNCTGTVVNPSATRRTVIFNKGSSTTSSLLFETQDTGDAYSNLDFTISCQKTGVDFIGKTAKAVASDQNVRSIGSIGVDVQTVFFGSGTNCTSVCSTGTCSICAQVGSKISSVPWQSTGQYRLIGIDGTKYNCTGNGNGVTYNVLTSRPDLSTSTYATIILGSGGTADNSIVRVTCTGIP